MCKVEEVVVNIHKLDLVLDKKDSENYYEMVAGALLLLVCTARIIVQG